ncbi:VOC family protein [Nonomuraea sp. NPDC048826]|uniref:VOC family protein n=1 Tax=Nonomuraea sp. NPDC048826 TaxID=3364347 RepID=UPI003720C8B5
MGHDITGPHHVGHLVHDLADAVDRYRRLGFTLAPPAYPVLPGSTRPAGVANAHAYFERGFLELVAFGRMPADARPLPLDVPEDRVPAVAAALEAVTASLVARLRRFQGVHIVMLDSADLEVTAARLDADGVGHGGVQPIRRPVETPSGTRMDPARYLELTDLPEGRVGMAQNLSEAEAAGHPNGAVGLAEVVLCVEDGDVAATERRYATYLGGSPGLVRVVGASAFPELFPGEAPPGVPGFAAFAVEVADPAATGRLLHAAGVPLGRTGEGDPFVPASEALGVPITFRPAR